MSLRRRNIHQQSPDTPMEIISATRNPKRLVSMPFTRFMPKSDAISVGNIMRMLTEVSVRMMVFILLLIIDVYVSIVDSRISE